MEQADYSDCTLEEQEAIRFLIGSLDDRGFLTSSLSDLALLSGISLTVMRRPVRCFATLILPESGVKTSENVFYSSWKFVMKKTPAYQMIDQWMDLLLRRRIPELSRKLSVSKDAVQEAIEQIAELDPNPGSGFRPDSNSTISPDASIEWDE